MAKKVLLPIGSGNVGSAAIIKAERQLGLQINETVRSSGVYSYDTGDLVSSVAEAKKRWKTSPPDIVFMTIPSYEDGKQAYDYLSFFTKLGVPVVTAEKGGLANYYKELKKSLDLIGSSATVGGGTRMTHFLADRMGPTVNQIHLVVNGTLNFIMDGVANGRTLGQVVDEAIKLGYAEPGADDPVEVINGEAVGDVPKKVSILWNLANVGEVLDWNKIKQPPLTAEDLRKLVAEAKDRRYIVSMYRKNHAPVADSQILASFRYETDEWVVAGGFQNINNNPLFDSLRMPGPSNGIVIATGRNEQDGVYHLSGPGAGPNPTAASMIVDAQKLLA